jgi:hypothetical protein
MRSDEVTGPQPPGRQPVPDARAGLPGPPGLCLTAAGVILLLAVHVRLPFLNLQVTGLILIATGLTWLWIPVRAKRELIRRRFGQVMSYLEWDPSESERHQTRRPLAELLADGTAEPGLLSGRRSEQDG